MVTVKGKGGSSGSREVELIDSKTAERQSYRIAQTVYVRGLPLTKADLEAVIMGLWPLCIVRRDYEGEVLVSAEVVAWFDNHRMAQAALTDLYRRKLEEAEEANRPAIYLKEMARALRAYLKRRGR